MGIWFLIWRVESLRCKIFVTDAKKNTALFRQAVINRMIPTYNNQFFFLKKYISFFVSFFLYILFYLF